MENAGLDAQAMFHKLCKSTHATLVVGKCPWCGKDVLEGRVIRGSMPLAELHLPDGFFGENSTQVESLPVARKAVADPDRAVRDRAFEYLMSCGMDLSGKQVEEYEHALRKTPDDLSLRILLLAYEDRLWRQGTARPEPRREHVLWIIKNRPDVPIFVAWHLWLRPDEDREAYLEAKKTWLRHIEEDPTNLRVLENAIRFFLYADHDLAIDLATKAHALDPSNRYWPDFLADLYLTKMVLADDQREAATKAIEYLETSRRLQAASMLGFTRFFDLGWAAVEAGDFDKGMECAAELARNTVRAFNPQARHEREVLLGGLALASDNLESAVTHLSEAASAFASQQLKRAAPNCLLAMKLLDSGRADDVVRFLQLCASSWHVGRDGLEELTELIQEGRTPDRQTWARWWRSPVF